MDYSSSWICKCVEINIELVKRCPEVYAFQTEVNDDGDVDLSMYGKSQQQRGENNLGWNYD